MKLASEPQLLDPLGDTSADAVVLVPSRRHTFVSDWMELVKFRLNMLVVVTTLVGYCVAQTLPVTSLEWWTLLAITLIGTVLSAAGASVLNQWWEVGPDALMRRTADRPLPAGRVCPHRARNYGLLMAVVGVGLLLAFVNPLTAGLSAATVVLYVLVYTPLKRVTTLNTLVGAIPGAIPPAMGVTAATGHLNWDAFALFSILFCWQLPHFLAIATLCREEYAAAGFKMLPSYDPTLGKTSFWIVVFNVLLLASSLMPLWSPTHPAGLLYLLTSSVLGVVFLAAGIRCALTRDRKDARLLFFVSIIYLPLLLVMILIDKL